MKHVKTISTGRPAVASDSVAMFTAVVGLLTAILGLLTQISTVFGITSASGQKGSSSTA